MDQRRRRAAGRDVDPWVMILAMELLNQISQLERKPPVTLAIMAACATLWFRPGPLGLALGGLGGGEPMMCPAQIVAGERPW